MKEEWKVYIKNVPGKAEEVIKRLVVLGAKDPFIYSENGPGTLYFIGHDGKIYWDNINTEHGQTIIDNYKEIKLWNDGDILINNDGTCYKVFSEYDTDVITSFFAYNMSISVNGTITNYKEGVWVCDIKDYRSATSTEVEHFFDLLHASNKDWDAKKKEIVDMKWKPAVNDWYWIVTSDGRVNKLLWFDSKNNNRFFNFGNCFKTKEEAKIAAKKIKDLLRGE